MPIYNNIIQILGTPVSVNDTPTTYTAESGRSRVVVAVMGYEGSAYTVTPTFTLSMGSKQFTLASSSLGTIGNPGVNLVFYLLEKDIPSGSQSITFSATPNSAGGGRAITLYTLSGIDQENPIYLNTKNETIGLLSVAVTVKARSGSFAIATLTSTNPAPPPFSATSGWTIRRDYVNSLNDFCFGIFDKIYNNDIKEETLTVTGDTSATLHSNLIVFNPWISDKVKLDLTANGYTKTAVSDGSTNTTIIGNTPANILEGDLMFAVIHSASSVTTGNSITPPAGWREVANNYQNNGNFSALTWAGWKIANTSESTTHTWTVGIGDIRDDVCTIFRIIGADKNTPIHTSTSFDNMDIVSPVSRSITTTKNNTLVLRIFGGKRADWLTAENYGYPLYTTPVFITRNRNSSFGMISGFATEYLKDPTITGTRTWLNMYNTAGAVSNPLNVVFNEAPKYILQAERFKETGIYQTFSDNFNRANTEAYSSLGNANYGELGPDWEIIRGGFRITANTFDAVSSDSYAKVAETTVNFSDDHEAEIRIATRATFDSLGPAVRIIANGCYAISSDGTNNIDRRIAYIKDNSTKIIIGTTNITFVAGDIIKLRVQGSTLTAYKNGVQIDQVSNTAITSGQPGIFYDRSNINASKGDNFYAVDLNPTPQRKVMQIFDDGTIQAGWFSEKELLAQMKVHANSDIWVGGLKEV